jgi:hypothetical protein
MRLPRKSSENRRGARSSAPDGAGGQQIGRGTSDPPRGSRVCERAGRRKGGLRPLAVHPGDHRGRVMTDVEIEFAPTVEATSSDSRPFVRVGCVVQEAAERASRSSSSRRSSRACCPPWHSERSSPRSSLSRWSPSRWPARCSSPFPRSIWRLTVAIARSRRRGDDAHNLSVPLCEWRVVAAERLACNAWVGCRARTSTEFPNGFKSMGPPFRHGGTWRLHAVGKRLEGESEPDRGFISRGRCGPRPRSSPCR